MYTSSLGVTTFRLTPFRRIYTLSNMTIGLKSQSGTTFVEKKNLRLLDVMSHLCFFFVFYFSHLFPPMSVIRPIDFTTSLKWKYSSAVLY